jgi:NADPH:quinone reductase-like Zn-dependent oxidoreductase
LNSSLEGFDI